jgi:pimeloyl-ACP methyl ester carboxylesterase
MGIAKLSTGVELYYETHGKGETVVLLQGTGFACDVWRDHPVSDLKDKYQFVIFDPRGIGRSSPAHHFFNIYQLAADTAALMDYLKIDQANVLGHSIGGRIALSMAVLFPGKVKSLFLASTGSGPAVRPGEGAIALPSLKLLEELTDLGFQRFIQKEIMDTDAYFMESFRKSHPEIVSDFWNMVREHHADLRTYLRYVFARHTFEITHQLGSIMMPVWIVIGDSDIQGSSPHVPQSNGLRGRMPKAVFRVLPQKSHGFFWEDPSGTKKIILEWLQGH